MPRRFHGDDWTTRRLLVRDPVFKTCWEDYEEALASAERFQGSGADVDRRARDYVALVTELEDEIRERLDAEKCRTGREDPS